MTRTTTIAAFAGMLAATPASSPADADERQEGAEQAVAIYSHIYVKEGTRWRVEAILGACGEDFSNDDDPTSRRVEIMRLHDELFGGSSNPAAVVVAVETMRVGSSLAIAKQHGQLSAVGLIET